MAEYSPPAVWTWDKENGGAFSKTNRPIAGPTHDTALPVGAHPLQLYSLATPNGQKVTILLEELLAAGHAGAEYDAWLIKIGDGDQFGSGFVDINPNSKIPALVDHSVPTPIRVFESGAILLYLAEKFGAFLPIDAMGRAEALNWLFWQMGSGPMIGGGFGHFFNYAPIKIEYAIDRFAMETKRLYDVANRRLGDSRFLGGPQFTIADIAAYPWLGGIYNDASYAGAARFLSLSEYRHVGRWVEEINDRPAVRRGVRVNRADPALGIAERHDAVDLDAINPALLASVPRGPPGK